MQPLAIASRPETRLALFWKLFAFAAAMLVGHFVAQFGAILLRRATRISENLWQPVLLLGIVLLVSALFLRVFERQSLRAIGIGPDRPWMRQTLLGLLLGFALVALIWCVLVGTGHATWHVNEELPKRIPQLFLAGVFAFAIGIYEEALCRGYALQILARWNRVVGVTVTGLYFVAVHLFHPGGTSPLVLINMLLVHVLYVVCFFRTRSLWLGIGIHVAWNFTLANVFGMSVSGRTMSATFFRTELPPSALAGNVFGPEAGLVVTAVLAIAVLLLWRVIPSRRASPCLLGEEALEPDAATLTPPLDRRAEYAQPALGPQSNRFRALDILRAVAVFGILPMNIQGFALHDSAVLNPYACEWTSPSNVAVWVATSALFGRKDLMLFAMMFGAGILMIADRFASAGRSSLQIHVQRMVALMLIAGIHAYLIWPGDILFTYSICGLLVFACRRWTSTRLLGAGIALFTVPILLLVFAQWMLPLIREDWRTALLSAYHPSTEVIAEYYQTYRGSWLSQMPLRVSGALVQHSFLLLIAMGWISAGMMLVGMGLYRLGYLTGERGRDGYWRLLAWTAPSGALLTLFGFWLNFWQEWRAEFSLFIGRLPGEIGAPFLALACIAVVMLIFSNRENSCVAASLAAVGRMSLTNYLMHSVICTFLFYGTGLAWIGRVDRVQQLFIVLAIWLVQMVYSPIWLTYFRFGPAEWLWRSMAYVGFQPMRKRGSPE